MSRHGVVLTEDEREAIAAAVEALPPMSDHELDVAARVLDGLLLRQLRTPATYADRIEHASAIGGSPS